MADPQYPPDSHPAVNESNAKGAQRLPNIPTGAADSGGASKVPAAPYPTYTGGAAAPSLPTMVWKKLKETFRYSEVHYCDNPDTRNYQPELDFAWSAICEVHSTHSRGEQLATGFLISSGVVITAGHVVNSPEVGPALSAWVTPGKFGTYYICAPQQATRFVPSRGWNPSAPQAEWDYGAIFLDNPDQFKAAGCFEFKVLSDQEIQAQGGNWTVGGYPADTQYCDRNRQPLPWQWWARGPIQRTPGRSMTLNYLMPTSAGQSGSPVYYLDGNQPIVIGIHTAGQYQEKWARRIDDPLAQLMSGWISGEVS